MANPIQASHCFHFESDFIGNWRCIPLCVRRKLDLSGVKLKLSHWMTLSLLQRQQLVEWPDAPDRLHAFRAHLRTLTQGMNDGVARDLPPAVGEPWQQSKVVPADVQVAADLRGVLLTAERWRVMSELERFALCKLARPGHDHQNLEAAFSEVLG